MYDSVVLVASSEWTDKGAAGFANRDHVRGLFSVVVCA